MRNYHDVWYIALGALLLSLFWVMVIPRHTVIKTIHVYEPEVIYVDKPIELIPSSDLMSYVGGFDLTAYCPCEDCCGEYGRNRPIVNHQLVVNTASGAFAEEGVTVAVDPTVIPYGTKIYIEGVGVRVAQDTGSSIKGDKIDVYYENHQDAVNFGVSNRRVWIINEDVELIK